LLFDKTIQILEKYRVRNFKNEKGDITKWSDVFCFDTVYYLLKPKFTTPIWTTGYQSVSKLYFML
ncbi:MAG: hypothetical protein U9Q98_08185, partial [Bacteroidota bacterium]|nr:hypothetical protein [Bacteroidota bacterium]